MGASMKTVVGFQLSVLQMQHGRLILLHLLIAGLAIGCSPDVEEDRKCVPDTTPPVALPPAPLFDPDSAYAFVEKQVAFGPRVAGSASHKACGDWLVSKLQNYGGSVIEQTG